MAIGAQGDAAWGLEQDPAGEIHRRHAALPEEMHPRPVEPEKPVLGEERLRPGVVGVTGHDEPVQRPAVTPTDSGDFLREDLEERLPLKGRDREGALRSVIAETRALPARHGECRHAAGAQRRLAGGPGPRPLRRLAAVLRPRNIRRRLEVREVDARGGVLVQQQAREPLHLGEVDLPGLFQQRAAPAFIQLPPKREDLALSGLDKLL